MAPGAFFFKIRSMLLYNEGRTKLLHQAGPNRTFYTLHFTFCISPLIFAVPKQYFTQKGVYPLC